MKNKAQFREDLKKICSKLLEHDEILDAVHKMIPKDYDYYPEYDCAIQKGDMEFDYLLNFMEELI